MKQIYEIVILIWYILFFAFFLYILLFSFIEHPHQKRKIETLPPFLSPMKLSILLYNKITIDAFIATLYFLILKGKIKIHKDEEGDYLTIEETDSQLSDSQKFVADFLVNVIGDGTRVTIDEIEHYCDGISGKGDFVMNFQIWYQMSLKESANQFYEPKFYYSKLIWLRNSGIVLFAINVLFKLHVIFGYLTVPAVILIFLQFNLSNRRTKEGNQLYYDYLSFKSTLQHKPKKAFLKQHTPQLLLVGTVLRIDNIVDMLSLDNKKELKRLHNALIKSYKVSRLHGDIL